MKKYKPIPRFNDHPNCKGHANWMLDSTLETEEDRLLLIKSIDNYLEKDTIEETKSNQPEKKSVGHIQQVD